MSLVSDWKILYTQSAAEDLRDLPRDVQKRIIEKMRFFVSTRNPLKFAKLLKDKSLGDFRFRVGDYRIAFEVIAEKTISVLRVAKRDEIYK